MFEFMRKHKNLFLVITLFAVAGMVVYALTNEEMFGPADEVGPQQPAAMGDAE